MRIGRIVSAFVSFSKLFGLYRQQLLGSDIIKGVKCIVATVLQRFPVFDLQLRMVQLLLNDFPFPHFDFSLPTGRTVEFLVVFAEVKAAVVQTLVEILAGYLLASLLELRTTASQFGQLLPESRKDNHSSHLGMHAAQHNPHDLCGIDVGEHLLHKGVVELLGAFDDADGGLEREQVGVDLVLLLLVPQQLLFKLVLPSYHEAAFGSQRHRHTYSIHGRLQRVGLPGVSPVRISVRDDDVAIAHLLERVLLVHQFIERSKNGNSSPAILELLSVLEQHVEEGRVAEVYGFQQFFELADSHDAPAVEHDQLAYVPASLMLLQPAHELWFRQLLELGRLEDDAVGGSGLFEAEPGDEGVKDGTGIGMFGRQLLDLTEGGRLRAGSVVFEEAAVEVVEEFWLLCGDEVCDFKEGGDGLCGVFMMIFPTIEKRFDGVIAIRGIDLAEERLCIFLHLLGGEHGL
jgi:hypothetical protein